MRNLKPFQDFAELIQKHIDFAESLEEAKEMIAIRNAFDGLIDLIETIEKDFSGVPEDSDADVLDEFINDCMLTINEFKMEVKGKKSPYDKGVAK